MEVFPPQLLQIIHKHVAQLTKSKLKQALGPQGFLTDKALRFFAPGLAKLSQSYTSERAGQRYDYLQNPAYRSAYLLYFLPINYRKANYVLEQVPQNFWKQETYHFLDLGCGPATASLAFLEVFAKQTTEASLEIHLVDQNKKILEDALYLTQTWAKLLGLEKRVKFKIFRNDLYRFRTKQNYDFIFFHHVLNEKTHLSALRRSQFFGPWLRHHLKPKGLVAVLAPALKRPTRELMAFRNHLIEDYGFGVLAPCLHIKTCPMLAATRGDWCHFYIPWQESESLKKLSQAIGTDNRYLKLSYILFTALAEKLDKFSTKEFLVVSNPMKQGSQIKVVLCGPAGRYHLNQEGDLATARQGLNPLRRGEKVSLPNLALKKGEFQVGGQLYLARKDKVEKI